MEPNSGSLPPDLPPSPSSAPEAVADENSPWRKVVWLAIAAAIAVPPVILVGFVASGPVRQDFAWPWFERHPGVLVVAAIAAASLMGIGLVRRWHTRAAVLRRGSIAALAVLGLQAAFGHALRQESRRSTDVVILCEVRQLSAAADQYFLENGVSTVDFAHLVGATNYLKAVEVIAGEVYPAYYTQGITITVDGIAGARTVTYAP